MNKLGVSPIVGTVLLVAIVVALAAIVAILVSGLGGGGAPTVTVWSSFENAVVPEEESFAKLNDTLAIELHNFKENLPVELEIILRRDDGTAENLVNLVTTGDWVTTIKCTDTGELEISADNVTRVVLVISPLDYDMKEIAENSAHAQEGAARAEWIATILGGIAIAISIVFGTVNYRRSKTPKSRKR
jgi:flagellin-like protein